MEVLVIGGPFDGQYCWLKDGFRLKFILPEENPKAWYERVDKAFKPKIISLDVRMNIWLGPIVVWPEE